MKTIKEISSLIGKTVMVDEKDRKIPHLIMDARINFGRIDVLIEPIGGYGEQWINLDKCSIEEPANTSEIKS